MKLFEAARSVSLTEVLKYFGQMQMSRKVNGLSCPLCGHNGCFGIYDRRTKWKCFSCGNGGDSISFVESMQKVSTVDAAKLICESFNISYDDTQIQQQSNPEKDKYLAVCKYVGELAHNIYSKRNLQFFQTRGLANYSDGGFISTFTRNGKYLELSTVICRKFPDVTLDELIDWGICDSHGNSIFLDRYIIPIKDKTGRVIAFGGRAKDGVSPKYINTKNNKFFSKRYTLFNYDVAKKYPTIYVVEGYFDALSLVEAGIPNVVATLGTSLTDEHIEMLKGKDIILAFDSDDAGQARQAETILKHKEIQFKVFKLNGYKDLNEALVAGENLYQLVKDIQDGPNWFLGYLLDKYDWSKLDDRNKAWREYASFLGANNKSWIQQYPINSTYTPVDLYYYWSKFNKLYRR